VAAFALNNSLDNWAGVGHSQGGMALVHLHNYYWSGLEGPKTSGRLVQTIGTPYNGVSGEGTGAKFIRTFGMGCGANYDLTRDGAKLWLAGITDHTLADVHYFTSTYAIGKLFGDHCSRPANLVLDWPNDGTTELNSGQLEPPATNHGNTQKYCHIDGMAYPGGYNNLVMVADMAANYAK